MTNNAVIAYTDGGSNDNPGISAWAFYVEGEIQVSGFGGISSNNEMELRAMIECLKYIGKDRIATIKSDSTYVIKGLTEWIYGWKRRGWITSSGTPVANRKLWEELLLYYHPENHTLLYVKGHSGVVGNEICDKLVQVAKVEKYQRREEKLTPTIMKENPSEEVISTFNMLQKSYNSLTEYDKRLCAPELSKGLSLMSYEVNKYI